jgi:putative ABC transport system permease protein
MNLTLPRFFLHEYRKRRKKTALITFALFWGTLSILILLAFGRGMTTQFNISFQGLGETLIMFTGGQTSVVHQGLPKGRAIRSTGDIAYLRERILEIDLIPESYNGWQVSAEGRAQPDCPARRPSSPWPRSPPGGRFESDDAAARKVAFIVERGHDLFGAADPVGKMTSSTACPSVIGVLQKKLQDSMRQGPDADQIYLPSSFSQTPALPRPHPSGRASPGCSSRRARAPRPEIPVRLRGPCAEHLEHHRGRHEGAAIFKGIEMFMGIMGGLTLSSAPWASQT